ncbi:MAG: hypothetical protein HYZ28_13460 [Myxococcales bacterium]|nr:hypothetical protein [Myxococcales bacterium]
MSLENAITDDDGVPLDLDEYGYLVPATMEWARPLFHLGSKLLDLYDQVTRRWRETCSPEQKTTANGVLLGLGDRGREALRSSQLLSGHSLFRDAVQVVRPMVEAAVYARFICKDGPDEMTKRAERFVAFQAVERQRTLEAIRGIGRLQDLKVDVRTEIERNYADVEDDYEGRLFRKTPFGCTFWDLTQAAGMEWLYRTAYNHASAFSHVTVGSLAELGREHHDLGLGLAVCTFPVVFRILDGALELRADPLLETLEREASDVCGKLVKGDGETPRGPR